MKIILFLMFIPNVLFSQDVRLNVISSEKITDSSTREVLQLTIINNTLENLCIRASTSLLNTDLLKEIVELAEFGDHCMRYDLWLTKKDLESGTVEDFPRFPLYLYRKTSFTINLSLIRINNCPNNLIQFSYVFSKEKNCEEYFEKFVKGENWDADIQKKYKIMSIKF